MSIDYNHLSNEPTSSFNSRVSSLPPSLSYVNGSTHLGSVARYSCHRSHSLAEGDSERACLAGGEWSGLEPSCSEIRCSLPPRPNNTIISVSR